MNTHDVRQKCAMMYESLNKAAAGQHANSIEVFKNGSHAITHVSAKHAQLFYLYTTLNLHSPIKV